MNLISKLNTSFGVGVISLKSGDLTQSVILTRARFKEMLDFNIVNDLCQKNQNFKDFLNTIREYDVTKPRRFEREFDKILNENEMASCMRSHKI